MDSLDLNLFGFDKILAVTCVLQLRVYFSLLFLGLLSAVSASAALAKLQAVCTRTSQRNSVNNVLKNCIWTQNGTSESLGVSDYFV